MKDISKIISIAFLSFSILLLCYVFYRSQIFHAGALFNHYLKYYVITFLFIILSFISFFVPKELKINITIFFVSSLIGIYLVEGYLVIKNNLDKKQELHDNDVIYKNNTGKDYDKRNEFQVYQELKKEDPNIVPGLFPVVFLLAADTNLLPLSGLANRKTIHCNENGYYSIYQSDRYGFNNPDEEWDKEKIDYLLIGDSFVHGECVNEPDTISGNLRKFNNNENGILNLGQGANGPLIEYATLREYLPVKKVKRVLWLYYEDNDLQDLNNELNYQILLNYLNDKNFTQNLILRKKELEKFQLKQLESFADLEVIKQGTKLFNFVKLNFLRNKILTGIMIKFFPPTKKFENILKSSNEFTTQNNSKLYFVYLPRYSRYSGNKNYKIFPNYKKIIKIVESLNIPIIDMHKELFEKHKDPLSLFPFRKKAHYTELGYQLVAETIFKKISEFEK